MRGIGEFLVSAYALLSEQVGISARETRRPVFIMDIYHEMVLSSIAHHVMKPDSPAMRGIFHEAALHPDNAPLMQQGEQLAHLLLKSVLVHIKPDAYAVLASVGNNTRHINLWDDLCGISVVAGARLVPFPVEEHIRDMVLGTEVYVAQSRLSGKRCAAHDGSGLDPLCRIGYLAGRVQVVDDIAMLKQLGVALCRDDNLPGRGVVGHDIHGRVHRSGERTGFRR